MSTNEDGDPAKMPPWQKCSCGAGPYGIHSTWCDLVKVMLPFADLPNRAMRRERDAK